MRWSYSRLQIPCQSYPDIHQGMASTPREHFVELHICEISQRVLGEDQSPPSLVVGVREEEGLSIQAILS